MSDFPKFYKNQITFCVLSVLLMHNRFIMGISLNSSLGVEVV